MTAYMRRLMPRNCVKCGAKATVEVFDTWNGSRGFHCTPCGKRLLAELDPKQTPNKEKHHG